MGNKIIISTHTLLISWVLLIMIAVLLLYRGILLDKVYASYTFMIALIILMLYGAQLGSDPKIIGTALYVIFFVSIILIMAQVTIYIDKPWGRTAFLMTIVFSIITAVMILSKPHYFEISTELYEPPYWYSGAFGEHLIYVLALFIILPLVLLGIDRGWTSNSGVVSIVVISYIILSGIIASTNYRDMRIVSVWFYLLTVVPLIFWGLGMFI